jgi:hypothetical protein
MKSTYSTMLRRTLGVAGICIGFGLLSAGVASADDGDSPGLLGGVASLVSPVADAVAPVTEPVLAPLAPVVDPLVQVLSPVLEPLQPVTRPVLAPVVRTVRDVPVVPRIAEPLVAQQSAPADGVLPIAVPVIAEVPWTPVVWPEARTVALPDRTVVAMFQQQIPASAVAPPIEAPNQPSPDVPFALPGATGTASSTGSAGPAVSDLPAESGARPQVEPLVMRADHQVHGSWCYYYGRNHPS